MNNLSFGKSMLIDLAAVLLAFLLAIACASDLLSSQRVLPMGLLLLLAGLMVGVLSAGLLMRRWSDQQSDIEQYIAALASTDPKDFVASLADEALPHIPARHPSRKLLRRLRDRLAGYNQLFQDAEQNRAKAEVRCRLVTLQCNRLMEILQGLNEPIVAVDSYGELVLANTSAQRTLEIPEDELDRKCVEELIRCEQLRNLLFDARRRRLPGQRISEVQVSDAQNQTHWYNVTVGGLGESDEAEEHGAVAVLRDISEQKAIHRRHAEFVSAVSHEMKTPLASIKAYVELLADGEAEDEQTREEFLDVINSQADRLQRLIDNVLNMARIEAGVVDVNKQQHSLNELLEEANSIVGPSAEQKQIQLNCELSSMYLSVLADRDMVLQTAINLLSNAIKYTPPGGTVALRSREADANVVFEVEDTGVGLNEEDRARVFEKFYRVKKDKNMASGTGLGLPLAKHIVEEVHRGVLSVESEEGKGSIFRVALPKLSRQGTM